MTSRAPPLFASERNAARLLDMRPSDFRHLVDAGALPGPENIHGFLRWRVAALEAINTGTVLYEEFEA
jgi:hypothetical protein